MIYEYGEGTALIMGSNLDGDFQFGEAYRDVCYVKESKKDVIYLID